VEFWTKHPQAEAPLKAWFAEANKAEWTTTADIKARYPSASFIANNRVIFNIGRNDFRLIVKIAHTPQIVYIRFVGTHAEYDKVDPETI
jgi:mRNA interferase HigB